MDSNVSSDLRLSLVLALLAVPGVSTGCAYDWTTGSRSPPTDAGHERVVPDAATCAALLEQVRSDIACAQACTRTCAVPLPLPCGCRVGVEKVTDQSVQILSAATARYEEAGCDAKTDCYGLSCPDPRFECVDGGCI